MDRLVMNREEAADFLRVSVAKLDRDRATGELGIPYRSIGKNIVYLKAHVLEWLEQQGEKEKV